MVDYRLICLFLGGLGVYHVPNHGDLVYAGIRGFATLLRSIAHQNLLDHPFCDNLRSGFWAIDYLISRCERYVGPNIILLLIYHYASPIVSLTNIVNIIILTIIIIQQSDNLLTHLDMLIYHDLLMISDDFLCFIGKSCLM